jgi:hypothetical protein
MAKPANAQTGVTQPAVPRFDVFLNTQPNYVPPVYGVDPSTGKAVVTKAGYEVLYKWVSVRVYGQPFWEYNNSVGQRVLLYYNVRWQSNLNAAWQSFPSEVKYFHDSMDPWDTEGEGYLISIGFKGIDNGEVGMQLLDPKTTKISFQVEALIGYYDSNNIFVGQSSGWSNTQTITIPCDSISISASPTATANPPVITAPTSTPASTVALTHDNSLLSDQQLTYSVLIATVVVLAIAVIALLIYVRKIKNRLPKQ